MLKMSSGALIILVTIILFIRSIRANVCRKLMVSPKTTLTSVLMVVPVLLMTVFQLLLALPAIPEYLVQEAVASLPIPALSTTGLKGTVFTQPTAVEEAAVEDLLLTNRVLPIIVLPDIPVWVEFVLKNPLVSRGHI
ncbi:MAG: hypothetical protein Q8P89_00655 [bacterium]|nr:hypothetical protein [bacterium]